MVRHSWWDHEPDHAQTRAAMNHQVVKTPIRARVAPSKKGSIPLSSYLGLISTGGTLWQAGTSDVQANARNTPPGCALRSRQTKSNWPKARDGHADHPHRSGAHCAQQAAVTKASEIAVNVDVP